MTTPFIYSKTVDFHETDLAGLVHFTNYIRWMELAEHAFLKSVGVPPLELQDGTLRGWPRRDVQCTYLAPLTYGDAVEIEVSLSEANHKKLCYAFEFFKVTPQERTRVSTGGMTTCLICGELPRGTLRAVMIPDTYLDKCRTMLGIAAD